MAANHATGAWQVGEWLADPATDTLSRGSETIKLEPRTMRLLVCLAESAGAVVPLERLLNEVWTGVIVGSASVYQAVSQLRKILGDTGPQPTHIATVARKGYRLVAPVQRVVREAVEPAVIRVGPSPPAPTTMTRGAMAEIPVAPLASPLLMPSAAPPKTGRLRRYRRWLAAAAGLAVVAAVAWQPVRSYLDSTPTALALVVLPMQDMSAEKADQPLCDGLTEEISNWLAQLPTLRVVARSSAMSFRDKEPDIRAIGRQLGVTHVLRGTLKRQRKDAVVISMQLYDASDAYTIWSAQVERPIADIAEVQSEIVQAVAANLEIRLTQAATLQLAERSRANAEAFLLFLLAQHYQSMQTRNDNEHSIELYRQAIAKDQRIAPAFLGLAWAEINQNTYLKNPVDALAEAVEPLVDKALSIEPNSSDAFAVRGALRGVQLRDSEAVADLKRAVEVNPNEIRALTELGFVYSVRRGEPREAMDAYDRAALIDPLNVNVHARRCIVLADLARFQDAESACARARALRPGGAWAYEVSSWLSTARGRIDEALRWNALAIKADPHLFRLYQTRAGLLIYLQLPDRAEQLMNRAGLATDNSADVAAYLPLVAYARGGEEALRRSMQQISPSIDPDPSKALGLARLWLLLKDYRKADELLTSALRDPGVKASLSSKWAARQGSSPLVLIAAVKSAIGDAQAAGQALEQLRSLLDTMQRDGVDSFGVYELRAMQRALHGDADGAMDMLQHAADRGWRNSWWAVREPYLASLESRRDFRALIARVDAINADQAKKPLGEL